MLLRFERGRREIGGIFSLADMWHEPSFPELRSEGFGIIGFIGAQMMNPVFGFRSGHDRSVQEVQDGGDIMRIGWRNADGQRCASLIHPQMAF